MMPETSATNELVQVSTELQQKVRGLEEELKRAQDDLEAANRILRLLRLRHNVPEPAPKVKPQDLEDMTYKQALLTIAQANGGRVKVTEAAKLLRLAGVARNSKTAYQQVTATILRSKRFKYSEPGVYELKGDTDDAEEP